MRVMHETECVSVVQIMCSKQIQMQIEGTVFVFVCILYLYFVPHGIWLRVLWVKCGAHGLDINLYNEERPGSVT